MILPLPQGDSSWHDFRIDNEVLMARSSATAGSMMAKATTPPDYPDWVVALMGNCTQYRYSRTRPGLGKQSMATLLLRVIHDPGFTFSYATDN